MRRLAIAGTVLLAVVSAVEAAGPQDSQRAGTRGALAPKNVAAPDESLRARIVDIQQALDRILAETTPAPVGTTGVSSKAAGADTQPVGATVVVERARLLQLRRQLDALMGALNKPEGTKPAARGARLPLYSSGVSAVRPIPPMMATRASALPAGDDWSYEVKWDGYRAQAIKNGRLVSLASRNLKDITRQFPAIAAAVGQLHAEKAIVDGEIVAVDAEGRPSFQGLHHWNLEGLSLVYYAFDLLHLDGRDLTKRPLDERRAALRGAVGGSGLLLSDPLPGTPQQIADAVRRLGLEGVVAKKRRSTYTAGRRSDAWIKVRFAQHQELVVGGYKPTETAFDSLLVGYYDDRKLMCAGKVRNGFTPLLRTQLMAQMRALEAKRCPFANLPSTRSGHWGEGITEDEMTVIRWVRPSLVVEVSFAEWTRDGSLRHAAFIALRDDKPARDVQRE